MKKYYFIFFFLLISVSSFSLFFYTIPKADFYYHINELEIFWGFEKKELNYKKPLKFFYYYSKIGDNLWNIAKRFNLNIDTIVSFNEVPRVHLIRPKLAIKIPLRNGIIFKREKNETLENLSKRYNIAGKKILFFNPDFYKEKEVYLPDVYYDLDSRMGKLGAIFLRPLKTIKINSLFGFRIHPISKKRLFHRGIDLRGKYGEVVFAAKGGRVTYSGQTSGFGKLVVIKHNNGYVSKYAHLSSINVKSGQRISIQHPIGRVGSSGRATGAHLHFEIWKNGRSIDPREVSNLY